MKAWNDRSGCLLQFDKCSGVGDIGIAEAGSTHCGLDVDEADSKK